MPNLLNPNILSVLRSLDSHAGCGDDAGLVYPVAPERAELLVAVRPADYSAALLARAVEDCDIHLVNMNLTSVRMPDDDSLVVALRVDCANPDAVIRSLERYGFRVIASSGPSMLVDDEEGRRRAAELLHILEI